MYGRRMGAVVVFCAVLGLGALAREAVAEDGPASDGGGRVVRSLSDRTQWVPTDAEVSRVASRQSVYARQTVYVSDKSLVGGSEAKGGSGDLAMQLQNPVANLISVPIQANLDHGFGPGDHAYRWVVNVQPVIPVKLNRNWNVISRTILPIVAREGVLPGEDAEVGLGDVVQSLFFSPQDSKKLIWGVGPVFLFPTATDDHLGAKQWGIGPTAVALKQMGPWTVGFLGNHIWSFADAGHRRTTLQIPTVNATFLQPFVSYTFPSAFSLTLLSESTYDWEQGQWNIPFNLVATQVTKLCNQPVSMGLGVRYWAETADGGPEWGIRLIFTLLFPKH